MASEFQSGEFISATEITENGDYPVYGGNGLRGYANRYNHEGFYALIGRQGALCGNVNCADGKAYFTEHAVAVQANQCNDTGFLVYLLSRMNLGQYSGQSAQPGLAVSTLKEVETLLPSKHEQYRIGSLLKDLDSLITLHQRKRKYRGLYGCLSWEQRKFLDVVDVCSGKDYKHLKEGSIPVYGTGGFMTSVDEALSYDRDAVGIGRKGTIDKPYLLKAPFWTVDTLFYAIPKSDIGLEFVHCSFLNVDWKSKDESTGLPSLSKEAINETIVLVPSFNEQSQLGEFFNNLDSLITLHQ